MDRRKRKALIKISVFSLCFIAAVSFVITLSYKSALRVLYPQKYTDLIETYSQEYKVDQNLLYAIIKTESGFDPSAQSDANALGLTQITADTFAWLQTKTGESLENKALLDADTSVKYGALFLSMLLSEFGDTKTAVAAYHAGRGQVNAWLADENYSADGKTLTNIPSADTSHYVNKVIKAYNIYNNLYDTQED